jgi:hypothetical protein
MPLKTVNTQIIAAVLKQIPEKATQVIILDAIPFLPLSRNLSAVPNRRP